MPSGSEHVSPEARGADPGGPTDKVGGVLKRRILILGGTGEAARLARLLASRTEFDVVTSLAGRTRRPAALPGLVRIGGFGGVEGLSAYLVSARVDAVVDATHPYAEAISRHAACACGALGIPRLQLWRPAWSPLEGDRWLRVANPGAAAEAVAEAPISENGCVFLSTGAGDVQAFGSLRTIRFLVRLVDAPSTPLPLARCELVVARGPFAAADERKLFREHRVELLVSRNSGGAATYPKLVAARELRIPVVMVDRPDPVPDGSRVETVEEALDWLARQG